MRERVSEMLSGSQPAAPPPKPPPTKTQRSEQTRGNRASVVTLFIVSLFVWSLFNSLIDFCTKELKSLRTEALALGGPQGPLNSVPGVGF